MHMHTSSHVFLAAYEWEMWSQWKLAVKDQNPSLWHVSCHDVHKERKDSLFFQSRNQPSVRCVGLVDVLLNIEIGNCHKWHTMSCYVHLLGSWKVIDLQKGKTT